MKAITFQALPTTPVRALQSGGPDAFGATPERHFQWRRRAVPPLPEDR